MPRVTTLISKVTTYIWKVTIQNSHIMLYFLHKEAYGMEFKDKLKKMRLERGISQQALADAIFVSRSAIAKWESGLGYPNASSMTALTEYFEVDERYFETEEVENVIVEKNKDISLLKTIILCVVTIGIFVGSVALTLAISSGNYGFTSKMVVLLHINLSVWRLNRI